MKPILALAAALALAVPSAFAADPQLLGMTPPDATMYAGFNVEQAKTSQFAQFLLQRLPIDSHLQEFITATGFDPRNDLREVLIATPASGSKDLSSGLVLAKGNFDLNKILALAAKDSQTVTVYGGANMLSVADGPKGEALAFLDSSTVVAGATDAVKAAIDRRAAPAVIAAAVMARINQLSATEDIWSVSTAHFADLPLPGGVAGTGSAILQSIQQASAGVKFGAQVQLDAQAVTGSAQDATSLGDVVKFLAQMASVGMSSEGNQAAAAQLSAFLKTVTVTTDQNIVKVSVSLPESQIESLFEMAESHDASHI